MRKIGNDILNVVKNLKVFILIIIIGTLTACDVHEWPNTPESVKVHLLLNYETEMTEWEHLYEDASITEVGYGETYDNQQGYGQMRTIVRAYPVVDGQRSTEGYQYEFVFTKDVTEGYDHEVTLDLLSGEYKIMVWSDLINYKGDTYFHDATNFANIKLQGEHKANSDHRDAFRGTKNISLIADIMEYTPNTHDITMQRPLAKYEFVTNDLLEFVEKEIGRVTSKSNGGNSVTNNDLSSRVINIEDYKVIFYYVGFMPNAYSINTDKPVDSSTGIFFESKLKKLTESEASIGFDYVFVNGKESSITLKIGVEDNEGTQLSLSEAIEVPLKRSHHTIMTGMFLMSEASGGVTINPDFDGDHNLIYP